MQQSVSTRWSTGCSQQSANEGRLIVDASRTSSCEGAISRAALSLSESKTGDECVIDRPQLLWREVSDSIAESLSVDSSELFDQDARRAASDGYLGAERGRSGAA